MKDSVEAIRKAIAAHPDNAGFLALGWQPLFEAGERARVVIIGHAPGRKAQESGLAWGDKSGEKLMGWLGVSEAEFRDTARIALIPMDFYYQGKGSSGDRPPRRDFAPLWHPRLLALMPKASLFVLVGAYAQAYYLGKARKNNLTETVRAYENYLPRFFPLVHPSPLNFRWMNRNPWFEETVLPGLKRQVRRALEDGHAG